MARNRILRGIKKKMLSGFMLILPLGITIFFLNILYSFALDKITPVLKKTFPANSTFEIKVTISVALLIVLLLILYILGGITGHFIGRMFWRAFENILMKVPLFNSIYKIVREIVTVFSAQQRASFREVVFVKSPASGLNVIGFVTGTMTMPDGQVNYKIFMPTSPNPTSGFILFVSEQEMIRTDITVDEGISIIISGGILGPVSALKTPEEKAALLLKRQMEDD